MTPNNIFLVRHGQSLGNVNKSVYYTTPDSKIVLTDKGKEQASDAGARTCDLSNLMDGQNKSFHVCYSPYERAKETKDILVDVMRSCDKFIDFQREDPRLREREWGKLRDINDTHKGNKDHFFDFFYRPEGGESFANCYDRVASFHQWLELNTKEENVIIVAHGESIKCYMAYLLGWTELQFAQAKNPKNCEVFLLERDKQGDDWQLSRHTPTSKSKYYRDSNIII